MTGLFIVIYKEKQWRLTKDFGGNMLTAAANDADRMEMEQDFTCPSIFR